ncbi:elys protein [Moniliophthora roreri MCA 2997]|uniref:Elys protein n=1 Tax=Moniliophthora roreri (strain MCA 2997) TaxID=1381753 RepID=V2WMS3_MONRO|nr:elys protein [Moniliophthora roreri MCA 2997]
MDIDTDAPGPSSTDLISYFEVTPTLYPWRETVFQEIERRRALLGDTLLFDILLSFGSIKEPDGLYPPANAEVLQRLLDEISKSNTYDALKKDCLVYYLLKWHRDGREARFQRDRSIPPQFVALADAYWYLDSGSDVARAVSLLSDPRLNRDYASKILQAISLSKDPHPLIVKYIQTAKPLLAEPDDLDTYTLALAHSNFFEAWQFQRTFNQRDPTRARLLKKLFEWCVNPTPRPTALTQLLSLPLNHYEQEVLATYAATPPKDVSLPPNALYILQNLVCVRLIQIGQHAEAVKTHRRFIAASVSNTSLPTSFEREEMIADVYNALPSVEKTILDAELERGGLGTVYQSLPVKITRPNGADKTGDISMSMSWEDIPRPSSAAATKVPDKALAPSSSTSGPALNFSLSGAPRFGGPIPKPSSAIPNSGASTPNPIEGLPPPSLSATALSLFGSSTSTSASNKRKSGGFSNPLSSTGLGKSFSSSTSTSRPPIIPTGTGNSTPLGPSTPTLTSTAPFTSSARRENAFFRPTPAQQQSVNGLAASTSRRVSDSGSQSQSPERPAPAAQEVLVGDDSMDVDDSQDRERKRRESDSGGLSFSVFGGNKTDTNATSASASVGRPVQSRKGTSASTNGNAISASTSKLPGSFTDEDEEEQGEDISMVQAAEVEQHTRRSSRQPKQTSSKGSRKSTATTSAITRSKTRQSMSASANLKRSVPGAMYDDDDDDDDGISRGSSAQSELRDEDEVPPLPAPSRRVGRKTRASAVSSIGTDEEDDGPKTRRRSSRLSTSNAPETKKASTRSSRASEAGTKGGRRKR